MSFEKLAEKRISLRRYSSKKPRIEDVMNCIKVANLAPSPGNLPILKFIVVEDRKKIEAIAEACQQDFIKQAQILVVLCSDAKNVRIAYDKRANRYVKHHVGAAIENFLLNITDLGLSSCWVGAYVDSMIKDLLEIPEEIDVEAVLPVAYQSKISAINPKRKSNLDNRIYFENWKNKFRKTFPKISD